MPNTPVPAAATGLPRPDPDRLRLYALRTAISARITRDIALLDALDGDPDCEPEPLEEQHDLEEVGLRIRGGHGA